MLDKSFSSTVLESSCKRTCTNRILGMCLYISSLPDKASRTLVGSRGMSSDSTCVLEAEPGKPDIKRRKPGILLISLLIDSLFKLAIVM